MGILKFGSIPEKNTSNASERQPKTVVDEATSPVLLDPASVRPARLRSALPGFGPLDPASGTRGLVHYEKLRYRVGIAALFVADIHRRHSSSGVCQTGSILPVQRSNTPR